MLSSATKSVAVSSIIVASDRQRRVLKDVESLADSIRNVGLINPIVITQDNVLVAGERRLRAHEFLGLTHILVRFSEDLSRPELELIELEENVKRSDLTWREQAKSIARIHALKSEAEGEEWSGSATAGFLAMDASHVNAALRVQEYIDRGDELVANAETFVTAINIVRRKDQRVADAAQVRVDEAIDAAVSNNISVNKGTKPRADSALAAKAQTSDSAGEPSLPITTPTEHNPYILGDFRKWIDQPYSGDMFNFIHCDFPYGVNFDKHNRGAAQKFGGYEDTPEVYASCLAALARMMKTHVAPSAHLMFWLSARLEVVEMTRKTLTDMGWKINPVPLIWWRSDNSGIMPDPQRGPRQVYELCLFGSTGDRKIVQPVSNLIGHAKTKEIHASEKPRDMLRHFFRMFVDETTVMIDPTMGSGNAIIAAEDMGAKSCLGFEAVEEFYDNAVLHRKMLKALSD